MTEESSAIWTAGEEPAGRTGVSDEVTYAAGMRSHERPTREFLGLFTCQAVKPYTEESVV